MAAINGTLIFFSNETAALVGQLDGSIGGSADQLDATTKDSTDAAKVYVSGETEWHGTVTALFDMTGDLTLDDVIDALKAGTKWTCKFGQVVTGKAFLTGYGYVKSWNWNGPKNAMANIAVEFQGTAAINTDTV
ncbi:MAG: phage tail tube protein [Dehalococcoidia bacterium]|jgi:TP901-1 family phage major tail protein